MKARATALSKRRTATPPTLAEQDGPDNAAETPTARAPQRSAPRAKPVRVTTDLAPQSYRALLAYCAEMAEDLGRAKVPHVEVIRALISELNANTELQATVRQAVTKQLSK
ncbi:hypothetical protein RCH16_003157 [Cryobacterium sp. MP_M5]|nr:hypothetical protein [Cryobacterium sp. MP_M3]MEC5178126.1 hypothetical protein [Cryobacterium sp. MP_M5]